MVADYSPSLCALVWMGGIGAQHDRLAGPRKACIDRVSYFYLQLKFYWGEEGTTVATRSVPDLRY